MIECRFPYMRIILLSSPIAFRGRRRYIVAVVVVMVITVVTSVGFVIRSAPESYFALSTGDGGGDADPGLPDSPSCHKLKSGAGLDVS
jgi:hypothetical protein